jgi:hypothetical protein
MNKAIDPDRLDDLAATVGLSVNVGDKANLSAFLASVREKVMRQADILPIDAPPALFFDPR